MNQLRNSTALDTGFCSAAELITVASGVNGGAHTIKRNGQGNGATIGRATAISAFRRAAGDSGNGHADLDKDGSEDARRIAQSISYMREHLNQPVPVAKLAAVAHVSPSHFFALFKRQTGCAPIDYFTHLRMQHACQLLDATSASVKEVAAVLGYDDPFYFSRVFKAVNRIPPSRYRAMQKHSPPALRPDKIGTADAGRRTNGNGVAAVSWPGNGKHTHQNSRIVHSLQETIKL
jgi:AraC-like DNA-binding protein